MKLQQNLTINSFWKVQYHKEDMRVCSSVTYQWRDMIGYRRVRRRLWADRSRRWQWSRKSGWGRSTKRWSGSTCVSPSDGTAAKCWSQSSTTCTRKETLQTHGWSRSKNWSLPCPRPFVLRYTALHSQFSKPVKTKRRQSLSKPQQ